MYNVIIKSPLKPNPMVGSQLHLACATKIQKHGKPTQKCHVMSNHSPSHLFIIVGDANESFQTAIPGTHGNPSPTRRRHASCLTL